MRKDGTSAWKRIWAQRSLQRLDKEDFRNLVLALKAANGFDVTKEDGVGFETWMRHISEALDRFGEEVRSVYEVGCGCGANLVMLLHEGVEVVGGADYSESLVMDARKVTGSDDICCCEATDIPIEPQYDVVFSDSVCQYYPDLAYAEKAFEAMLSKARRCVAIMDVHDARKRDAWLRNRMNIIPDYAERYGALDDAKLFIEKDFFAKLGKRHGLRCTIVDTNLEGYWNERYTYSAYLYL